MATMSMSTATAVPAPTISTTAVPKRTSGMSSPILGCQMCGSCAGMPSIGRARGGKMMCSVKPQLISRASIGGGASVLSAASLMGVASPVLALVDDRMSTEGTGLSLGISNNLLGWILVGVFGLIWALYFVYTSSLDEDEDSGLSL
ncbi:hypothetical protein Cni_G17654 [Canna indica]|uniref:PSII 6.1 kDa protein n=1 Tax=Canna indica TaxID=4628 RepID=A0AAQ3QDQ9_9LILI|nr:hypothetical protein Cni_G17654 [Canna indica]